MPDESRSSWDRRDCASARDVAGKLPSEQPKGRPSGHGWPRETIMTPDTQQPRTAVPGRGDAPYPPVSAPAGLAAETAAAAGRHERTGTQGAARARHGGAAPRPSHASPRSRADAKQAKEDAGIVGVVPL